MMGKKASEAQRERWREYNKSERGRARYRKWQRSLQGKRALQKAYQEQKNLLDIIKRKLGCEVCRENDPRILRFYPRDPKKIKFSPVMQNATRSIRDWLDVIRASDVLCLNCLGKKKASQKSGRSLRGLKFRARMPRVRRSSGKLSKAREDSPYPEEAETKAPQKSVNGKSVVQCSTCETAFVPKKRNKKDRVFCSPRCRLLFWAARKILEAYRLGQAAGLRGIIAELAEMR